MKTPVSDIVSIGAVFVLSDTTIRVRALCSSENPQVDGAHYLCDVLSPFAPGYPMELQILSGRILKLLPEMSETFHNRMILFAAIYDKYQGRWLARRDAELILMTHGKNVHDDEVGRAKVSNALRTLKREGLLKFSQSLGYYLVTK